LDPFEEEEEGTGITNNVVKVKGADEGMCQLFIRVETMTVSTQIE